MYSKFNCGHAPEFVHEHVYEANRGDGDGKGFAAAPVCKHVRKHVRINTFVNMFVNVFGKMFANMFVMW